ncbi:MAG: 8-amino-7-oxononanoate synthase [Desulfopila sp.]|nr:8-amino-7-oxononanoate synthase [Desulfopila sp.]
MKTHYSEELQTLAQQGSLRTFRPLRNRDGCRVEFQKRTLLNLTSNDYLGIAADKELHRAFYAGLNDLDILESFGLGAASSRLLSGDNEVSHLLEERLCLAYQRPACLLFNSGYHANIGILQALTSKSDLILSDKLNHASIHDGLRLSRAAHKRFRHADYEHLYAILEKERQHYNRVIVVTESVFSMDGDEADLHRLVDIKKRFDCLLYVDEAHAVGLYGAKGLGKAEQYGLIDDIDLLVGTFGKACGSVGAFVVCHQEIYDYLVNFSRSLIFTTALPPVVIHWNLFVFNRIQEMQAQRQKLKQLSDLLRLELEKNGLRSDGSTNIIPVILGDNQLTVDMAEEMQRDGYLIFAVRPPTVPQGTARFRLSLTADMDWDDLAELARRIRINQERLRNA